MKKHLLSVIALSAIMSITGCGTPRGNTPAKESKFAPTAINLNTRSVALYVGETFQIESDVTPILAHYSALKYESSDENIAKVSDSGVITAVKDGHALITVSSKADGTVNQTLEVFVTTKKNVRSVNSNVSKMKKYQEDHIVEAKKLRTYEVETRTYYTDGVKQKGSTSYEELTTDKENGYFYVGGLDVSTRVEDGAYYRGTFGYIMFTNPDYDSHIYHFNDYSKNRCELSTQYYLDKGVSRIEVVYMILDSLFTSGRDIANDLFEDELGTDWFDYITFLGKSAGVADDALAVTLKQTISGDDNLSTPTMEQNLDIPCYIPYTEADDFSVYWYKGVVKSYRAHFTLSYDYNGHHYDLDIDRRYTFYRDEEVEITYPNKNEYQKVNDVFDL